MTARGRLSTAAVGVLSLFALSACEKPAPIVTVVNAGRSVYSAATTYCFEGQSVPKGDCAVRAPGTTGIAVEGGKPVGIDVAKPLVDRGWIVELSDPAARGAQAQQPQQSEVQHTHYYSFTAPNLPQGSALLLVVRALGNGDQPSGEWRFTLSPR